MARKKLIKQMLFFVIFDRESNTPVFSKPGFGLYYIENDDVFSYETEIRFSMNWENVKWGDVDFSLDALVEKAREIVRRNHPDYDGRLEIIHETTDLIYRKDRIDYLTSSQNSR